MKEKKEGSGSAGERKRERGERHSPHVNNKPISIPYLEQGYRCNITIFNLKVEF